MLMYIAVLAVVVVCAMAAQKSTSRLQSNILYGVMVAMLVLVAGLRDRSVGTDTEYYVRLFGESTTWAYVLARSVQTYEIGYYALNWVIRAFTDQYHVLLLTIAAIAVAGYVRAIRTLSLNPAISSFVFVALGSYTFFFNGARQGIACAICALAVGPLLKRDLRRFVILVVVAALFHKTALVLLPFYFVLEKSNTLRTNVLYGLVGVIGAITLQPFVGLASQVDPRYQSFSSVGSGGGYYTVAFIVLLTTFFLLFKKSVRVDRERYEQFLNMLIFGTVISLVSALARVDPSGVGRIAQYFTVSIIFLWPIVYRNISGRNAKLLFAYVFVVVCVAYFLLSTQRFGSLTPYVLNEGLAHLAAAAGAG